jgi:Family of unknown function (DUF695)
MNMKSNKFELIDEWTVSADQSLDFPMIVRIRSKLDSMKGRENFPHMMRMAWSFKIPGQGGMPSKAESDELSKFEKHLERCFESDLQSVLTIVITKNGLREWYFYTNGIDEFMERLRSVPHENQNPIEIYFTSDENWKYYEDIKKNCESK